MLDSGSLKIFRNEDYTRISVEIFLVTNKIRSKTDVILGIRVGIKINVCIYMKVH